jgi:hypothetical protein
MSAVVVRWRQLAVGGALLLAVCATESSQKAVMAAAMQPNDVLNCPNDRIYSDNGQNFLLCTGASGWATIAWVTPFWSWTPMTDSSYGGYGLHQNQWSNPGANPKAVMQNDGNFVLYNNAVTSASWSTSTYGHPFATLKLQDDGNMVVDYYGIPYWSLF